MEWKVVSPLQQSNLHNLLLDEVCDSFPGRRDLFAKPFPVTDESGAVWTEIREQKGNALRKIHPQYTTNTRPHLQHQALVEVVSAGPTLQGGESHVSSSERRDVAELVRAQCRPLVVSRADVSLGVLAVGLGTRGAVVLVGQPGPVLLCALVDGEALRPTGVEFQSYIGYLESLPCGGQIWLALNGVTERITVKTRSIVAPQLDHGCLCKRQIWGGGGGRW